MKVRYTILERLRSQEPTTRRRAIKTIYTEAYQAVRGYVCRNSGTAEEAREMLHAAWEVFHEKIQDPDFKLRTRPEGYLYAVAKNLWLQRLRRRKRRAEDPLEEEERILLRQLHLHYHYPGVEQLSALQVPLEKEADLQQTATNIVLDIMQDESFARCREVIWDFYREDMSMADIAEKHGYKSAQTAKSKKAKCLAKLKALCAKVPFIRQFFLSAEDRKQMD